MALHDNFELANQPARELQQAVPKAVSAHYDRKSGHIVINLASKLTLSFSPRDAQELENARPSQLDEIEISPSGFGIHFPKLDAVVRVHSRPRFFWGSRSPLSAGRRLRKG